ncbi:hypothetical protein BW21_6286 (plasmid) [Burkholderia humptydooensis]|uniref:Levanase n=1 Tax=Burkholderia humptydooensis MSMB43 TaxID=441157 RepID=A0ABN0FXB5_9BURK|nr:hypothetical protein BW21_6286 [Burkholderia sp. 2002721687]ALX44690.1 hypothetical protein AQ610_19365 [Burkholderia humptydooensis]EIP84626.1 Levanase [Burkholderia humptydooensis MSMB43]
MNLALQNGRLPLEIVVDRGSVEVFAGGGRTAITDLIFPPLAADRIAVFAEHGSATFGGLTVTNLAAQDDAERACEVP